MAPDAVSSTWADSVGAVNAVTGSSPDGSSGGSAALQVPTNAPSVGAVPAVRLSGLRKEYGQVVALDGIDLEVPTGSVFGYLGPNGAGKTTSLRIMLGLIRASSGSAELFGRDPARAGSAALEGIAGFVEAPTFYGYLSGRRNLHLLADLDGGEHHDRVEDALDIVGLVSRGDDRVGGYSQGMRQRLGLAAALLRQPRLLLLDEPTNGLDPSGMRDMRALVSDLSSGGLTVLLSSHLMAEVEQLCSHVAVIARGRIRFTGTLEEFRDGHGEPGYRLLVTDLPAALQTGRDVAGVQVSAGAPDELVVTGAAEAAAQLTVRLGMAGVGILSMLPDAPTLEELFFDLTEGAPGQDGAAA